MKTVYAKKTVCTFSNGRRCWCGEDEATEVFIVQKCVEQKAVIFCRATNTYANASLCVEWSLKYANAVIKRMYLPQFLCAATGALHRSAAESAAGLRAAPSLRLRVQNKDVIRNKLHRSKAKGKCDRKVSNPHLCPIRDVPSRP